MDTTNSNEKKNKTFESANNMIKTIKSNYIIKYIFSYLYENKKLELIKYNKKCQKILKIDINDYKEISGKFIEGERNGKGKEYNDDYRLLFEGEYLNGKRHGKGKEYYDNGKLRFEGEYLNGKKIKGIVYSEYGEKIVELNGEKEKNIIIMED